MARVEARGIIAGMKTKGFRPESIYYAKRQTMCSDPFLDPIDPKAKSSIPISILAMGPQ
jgi:hypothetical protein